MTLLPLNSFADGAKATVTEEKLNMKSYLFGDPDPVANMSRIYPYFRFDSYSSKAVDKKWNMVVLENDHIKVWICPEVGGKVWGAVEKSTGKEFLYFNHVAKFRDVAMRGAWSSGGLEYNFGDIGHIPTCATPVDYTTKTYPDGSVSCIVGAIDLPSRTKWNVEIKLEADKAFFETIATWTNNTPLPCTYYHWMNAAAKSSGNLEFIYPGKRRIGHGGELGDWKMEKGRDLSFYENNDFGIYKSYHIINSYSDFFGGYWHDDNFGYGHQSSYADKPGKKLWIWGLSDQGMIWEDLLTDNDGQYIEYQAGKLFNQAAYSSTFTPFKHKEFTPFDTDVMREIWFPLKGTKGMVDSSRNGILNVVQKDGQVDIYISALQPMDSTLIVKNGDKVVEEIAIKLKTLELHKATLKIAAGSTLSVQFSDLTYSSNPESLLVDRPVELNKKFDWDSTYGIYTKALELEKQRRYPEALAVYLKCLEKDGGFLPALNRVALAYYRQMDYKKADSFARQALSIDAYDGEANYAFGLISNKLGELNNARSGFSIAAASVAFRSAAYTELSKSYLKTGDFATAINYTKRALDFNKVNMGALEVQAIAYRKQGDAKNAKAVCKLITEIDGTHHFALFETAMLEGVKIDFNKVITNELPFETYLEIAINYHNLGCNQAALFVLKKAPENAIVLLWQAYLDTANQSQLLTQALAIKSDMVFPHRNETAEMLKSFISKDKNWKLSYYYALSLWNKGRNDEAKQLFMQCGNQPQNPAFYLSKAKLFSGDGETVFNSLKRATELDANDWRATYAMVNYLQANDKLTEARRLSEALYKKHPENAVLGMSHAKSLILLKQYDQCVAFLEAYQVLPFEGATIGRDMYHEACIRRAYAALKNKEYSIAVTFAKKAKLWPKNLGVGKPYDVDERLDNFLIALAIEKSGNKTEANQYYSKVAKYTHPRGQSESSKLYLQHFAMKKSKVNGDAFVAKAAKKFDNEYVRWVTLMLKDKAKADVLKNKIITTPIILQPYDTRFIDREFELTTDCLLYL